MKCYNVWKLNVNKNVEMWIKIHIKNNKKNIKKSVDSKNQKWYSYTCPQERDKQSTKNFLKSGWQIKMALIKWKKLK